MSMKVTITMPTGVTVAVDVDGITEMRVVLDWLAASLLAPPAPSPSPPTPQRTHPELLLRRIRDVHADIERRSAASDA